MFDRRIFYIIFFLSGATGLVYEVIWVRLTGLVFGNTSHAISTVLGAFMAGLALGSWKLGRMADRVANPLRAYGLLEIGIGISAALVPLIFRGLDSVYWAVAPALSPIPGAGGFVRFGNFDKARAIFNCIVGFVNVETVGRKRVFKTITLAQYMTGGKHERIIQERVSSDQWIVISKQ